MQRYEDESNRGTFNGYCRFLIKLRKLVMYYRNDKKL